MGHKSHCGIEKMKTQFRQLYYWPGMSNEIENHVQSCQRCRYHLPSLPKEPLVPTVATRPMQRVGVDIFEGGGKHYLCIIDRFSGFPFAAPIKDMTTATVVKEMDKIFFNFGFAEVVRSDNGPAFRSDFKAYCQENGMVHETSSPHFPQSNGHAECGVRICKQLLQKCNYRWDEFLASLLEWRNVPGRQGLSPAQLMFGRTQKDQATQIGLRFRQDQRECRIECQEG